jgi:hypothetical protein
MLKNENKAKKNHVFFWIINILNTPDQQRKLHFITPTIKCSTDLEKCQNVLILNYTVSQFDAGKHGKVLDEC